MLIGRYMLFSAFRIEREEDYVIIREVYEHEEAQEEFESELEIALDKQANIIIIEPSKLGDETARWITVGNCLHKTAVLAGLGSIVSGLVWPDQPIISAPLCGISLTCAGIYAISWQFDPCCKYQVEHDVKRLQKLPLHQLTSSSPVVLLRRDDSKRKALHNLFSLSATALCAWKFYQWYYR